MTNPGLFPLTGSVCAVLSLLVAAPRPAPTPAPRAASTPAAMLPAVAADLSQRLARWKPVAMPFERRDLSSRERQMIEKLIDACRDLENIYWRQSDPDDIALYNSLAGAAGEREKQLRRLLWINGGRWDLLDENRPFLGTEPMPPGRALYPKGLTRGDIEAYVRSHPAEKSGIYNDRTVVRRNGERLDAVPYRIAFREWLEPAAGKLNEAAELSDEKPFANFLRLRAKALLTDDYYESDVAWVELVNPKFDLIYAPYETYLDSLLGVKASYGAAVMVRNEAESRKLAVFQKYVPEIQEALPVAPEDRPSKRGHAAPMEVMDTPFRAGDLRHGYQAVADNLPNDPRIHQKVGSKRIFFKNYMEARVQYVIVPVARRLLREDQAAKTSAEGYLIGTLMHEISHGLGPAYARIGGKQTDIREAIGPAYSGLEEAKADVTGMFGLAWLVERGALPKARLPEFYASYVAGIFRTVRFGTGEAHGRAEMMEFNYLIEQGAIARDPASGRYALDEAKLPSALAKLTKELLAMEATGDRARTEAWFKKYEKMPPELASALEKMRDIPVDIDPQIPFPEGVR
jgi:hypothetical protein